MTEDKERIPQVESEPETVELGEGLRKGLDVVDTATPPLDQFRPHLDASPSAPQSDQAAQGGDAGGDQGSPEGSDPK